MTIIEIKKFIFENSKIEFILEKIQCHHIQYHNKGYYTCANKDGDNKTAIIIYNDENLKCVNYTRTMCIDNYADLITLVGFNMKLSFIDSLKFLHNVLGIPFISQTIHKTITVKNDPLNVFKKVKKKKCVTNLDDIELYDSDIIKEYISLPHIDWIRTDGILPFTCTKFKIGYSAEKKRIIIPWRWWCGDENDFVGIIGRTTISEWKMLDIPKYFPLKKFPKSINIYGLQENYETIQKENLVVVFESEKSTLKRHSRKDGTGVSIGSHDISDEQVKILISLNTEIVICMDKDVSLYHVRSMCEKFYGIRTISYIFDKYGLLEEKESPADKPEKVYRYLLKYRVAYDETEHKKYIKERDKRLEKTI